MEMVEIAYDTRYDPVVEKFKVEEYCVTIDQIKGFVGIKKLGDRCPVYTKWIPLEKVYHVKFYEG